MRLFGFLWDLRGLSGSVLYLLGVAGLVLLLTALYLEQRTGALVLQVGAEERRIYVEAGQALMATSTAAEDRFVELLYREGRLDEEAYQKAAAIGDYDGDTQA